MTREEKIEKLCISAVDSMDMDDLIQYFMEDQENYLTDLSDSELNEEYKRIFDGEEE